MKINSQEESLQVLYLVDGLEYFAIMIPFRFFFIMVLGKYFKDACLYSLSCVMLCKLLKLINYICTYPNSMRPALRCTMSVFSTSTTGYVCNRLADPSVTGSCSALQQRDCVPPYYLVFNC